MRIPLVALAAPILIYATADTASATILFEKKSPRRTKAEDFALKTERVVMPNGLVVLLAPDPSVSSVMVRIAFRAGALFEPAGQSGIAHLVEHIMTSGPTKETDYFALLESRR